MRMRLICKAFAVIAAVMFLLSSGIAEAQSGYRIKPGDTLQIEVLEDSSLNRSVLVLPDGTISFPFIGSLSVGGMTVSDVRFALTAGLASNFAEQPSIVVSVASVAEVDEPPPPTIINPVPRTPPTIDVYITGEINNAGRSEVTPGTTILQFIAASGGLTPFAAPTRIELHRTDRLTGHIQVYLFSYNGKGRGPRLSPGTKLAPGDVVIVPARRLFE